MKQIVLTGAPCVGKTDFIRWYLKEYKNVYSIPEIATMLKEMGLPYTSTQEHLEYECSIYKMQIWFEQWVSENLPLDAIVICDRGTLDVLAFEDITGKIDLDYRKEYARYTAILHFKCCKDPEIYGTLRGGHYLRDESFEQITLIDRKLSEIWRYHPEYHSFEWEDDKTRKYEKAARIMCKIASRS